MGIFLKQYKYPLFICNCYLTSGLKGRLYVDSVLLMYIFIGPLYYVLCVACRTAFHRVAKHKLRPGTVKGKGKNSHCRYDCYNLLRPRIF